MRIAIVDGLDAERAQLKERLVRQLRARGTEAELLEFDSGEAFLAAENEQRFSAAFLDIYMEGLSGMEAAKGAAKKPMQTAFWFLPPPRQTTHSRAFRCGHFIIWSSPFSEAELSGLLDEMLAKLPRRSRFWW